MRPEHLDPRLCIHICECRLPGEVDLSARQENIALIEPTAEDAATLASFSQTFVSTLPETEIAQRGIEDPAPLIDDMVSLVDKWKSLLAEVDRSNVDEGTALPDRAIFDKIDIEAYGVN